MCATISAMRASHFFLESCPIVAGFAIDGAMERPALFRGDAALHGPIAAPQGCRFVVAEDEHLGGHDVERRLESFARLDFFGGERGPAAGFVVDDVEHGLAAGAADVDAIDAADDVDDFFADFQLERLIGGPRVFIAFIAGVLAAEAEVEVGGAGGSSRLSFVQAPLYFSCWSR